MIISKSKKVAYIGIPHTGSSLFHQHFATCIGHEKPIDRAKVWCRDVTRNGVHVDDVYGKHAKLKDIRDTAYEKLGVSNEEFDSEYKILAVVKHPTKWLLSDWDIGRRAYAQFKDMSEKEILELTRNEAQTAWIMRKLRSCPKHIDISFLESVKRACNPPSIYLPYLNSSAGSIETLKFEDFAETYTTISNAFGVEPPSFGHLVNASTYNQEEVCETSKEMVYERYIYDFKRFEYEYEF